MCPYLTFTAGVSFQFDGGSRPCRGEVEYPGGITDLCGLEYCLEKGQRMIQDGSMGTCATYKKQGSVGYSCSPGDPRTSMWVFGIIGAVMMCCSAVMCVCGRQLAIVCFAPLRCCLRCCCACVEDHPDSEHQTDKTHPQSGECEESQVFTQMGTHDVGGGPARSHL